MAQPTPSWHGDIPAQLDENVRLLMETFNKCSDFVLRQFHIPRLGKNAAAAFIDGLVNHEAIMQSAIQPLLRFPHTDIVSGISDLEAVGQRMLISSETSVATGADEALDKMLHGDTLILIDGMPGVIILNVRGWDRRSITEPQTETVVRGPREGFTETLRTNTSLIRRRIASSDLRMELVQVGERSHTNICIAYLEGLAKPELVEEARTRLSSINMDFPSSSGMIAELIKDSPYSLFDTIGYTEKPDVIAAQLMEGRVAVIVDGTPFVLTIPMMFVENFQTSEDYLIGPIYATFLRSIRLLSFFISFLAPALYVALTVYHQELIPTTLLFTMIAAAEGLPFPAAVEMALMLVIFEILKEAGIRLPKPVGQAVSIVGALVMGQAAIQAGLVGAPVVIVVALTGVASFAVPMLSNAMTLLRWYTLVLAAVMGGYGVMLGIMTTFVHIASLQSFGIHHLSPISPLTKSDLKDSVVRVPLWKMRARPSALHPVDRIRIRNEKPRWR